MNNATMHRALEAYGGMALWENAKAIEAEVSVEGLLFTIKRRPPFKRARILMDITRPSARLTPIGNDPQITGILDGHDVRLEDQEGHIIARRNNARQHFSRLRRLLWWDDLDMAYFANYAFWNYFTFPALLMRDDIQWKELAPNWLEATFPAAIPTHSRVQRFRFSVDTGLLIQHDYCADVVSRLANAANVVLEHTHDGGAVYASDRAVFPRLWGGKPVPTPPLIDIKVHHLHLER